MELRLRSRIIILSVSSSVYWTESSTTGVGSSLYRHDSQTTHMVLGRSTADEVYSGSQSTDGGCSCQAMSLSEMFVVDITTSRVNNFDALFVWDRLSGEIWTSDRRGCRCRLLRSADTLAEPHIGQRLDLHI